MATLANGATRIGRYGPGDDSSRPEHGRWVYLTNSSGYTMFIPENSQAERTAVYNNFPYKTNYARGYGTSGTGGNQLWHNENDLQTNGPCWSPSFPGPYVTPPNCDSGFTQDGSVVNEFVNPNDYQNLTTQHKTIGWEFYLQYDYGCPSGFKLGASTRFCYKTADSSYGATAI